MGPFALQRYLGDWTLRLGNPRNKDEKDKTKAQQFGNWKLKFKFLFGVSLLSSFAFLIFLFLMSVFYVSFNIRYPLPLCIASYDSMRCSHGGYVSKEGLWKREKTKKKD